MGSKNLTCCKTMGSELLMESSDLEFVGNTLITSVKILALQRLFFKQIFE